MLDRGLDQAAGLRALMPPPALGVLAFPLASGGDERWIAQLAQALRALGRRPVVVDAARGTVASAFGLRLRHDLIDLMQGEHEFEEVAQATASGVYVLRADRGVEAFVASGGPASRLLGSFARLSHGFDDLLLAMPAEELACLTDPQDCVPVIGLSAGSAGMVQAYSTVKRLAEGFGYRSFACVVQGADSEAQAGAEHARLAAAAERFLGAEVRLAGSLATGDAAQLQRVALSILEMAAVPLMPQ